MFRRPDSRWLLVDFPLYGLDKESIYQLKDVDTEETREVSGKELVETGILVKLIQRQVRIDSIQKVQ